MDQRSLLIFSKGGDNQFDNHRFSVCWSIEIAGSSIPLAFWNLHNTFTAAGKRGPSQQLHVNTSYDIIIFLGFI
jgi:hypothetical protein